MTLKGEARREYSRKWIASRRQEWINFKGGCCARCGSTERLEVDHIDPAKKTIHTSCIWSRTAAVAAAELANCQVLCTECHLLKTFGPESNRITHGTITGYKHHRCRCPDCRKANALAVRKRRAAPC